MVSMERISEGAFIIEELLLEEELLELELLERVGLLELEAADVDAPELAELPNELPEPRPCLRFDGIWAERYRGLPKTKQAPNSANIDRNTNVRTSLPLPPDREF